MHRSMNPACPSLIKATRTTKHNTQVRQQHKSVTIAKNITDKYFEKLRVAKSKIKILEDYISSGRASSEREKNTLQMDRAHKAKKALHKMRKKRKRKKIAEITTTPTTATTTTPILNEIVDMSNAITNNKRSGVSDIRRESKKKIYSFASGDAVVRKKHRQNIYDSNQSSINSGYDLVGGIQKVFKSRDKRFVVRSGGSSHSLISKKSKSKSNRIRIGVVKNHDTKRSMKKSKSAVRTSSIKSFFVK